MKIKLTESQLKKAKLITEGQEVVHTFLTKADDIKEIINRMYSKLSFATLAELVDGDVDLGIMTHKLEQLRTIIHTHNKKSEMFFNSMGEEEFYANPKWEQLQNKVEDAYQEVLYDKLDVLEEFIEGLQELGDGEVAKNFKDIKRMDL